MKLKMKDIKHKITCEISFNEKEFDFQSSYLFLFLFEKLCQRIYKCYFIVHTYIHLELN